MIMQIKNLTGKFSILINSHFNTSAPTRLTRGFRRYKPTLNIMPRKTNLGNYAAKAVIWNVIRQIVNLLFKAIK